MDQTFLEQIASNTQSKQSLQIVVSDNKTKFKTRFNPPIELDKKKKYEIALVNLETYYSFPNIDSTNNRFRYSPDDGKTWFEVSIPEGSYEINNINECLKRELTTNGQFDAVNETTHITFSANVSTLRATMSIDNSYTVDFAVADSICSVLGFNKQMYRAGYHESENIVNIMSINSIFVNIDIIAGSYVNGVNQPTVYSFFPNANPGQKIIETPTNLVYLPITLDTIHNMETVLTDQDGKQLNLRGEYITIRFHMRQV
jgi:hypothetical protein